MVRQRNDVLQGTLAMLVLRTLVGGPLHGYGITLRIQRVSDDALRVEEGSLYPALHRMEQDGWIVSAWGTTENNRRARFYSLTADGERQLAAERRSWEHLTLAVSKVLALG